MNSNVTNSGYWFGNAQPSGFLLLGLLCIVAFSQAAERRPNQIETVVSNLRYLIELDVDHQNASFSGYETIRITNSSRDDIETISFHLYPNIGLLDEDEPLLSVRRITVKEKELRFNLRSRQTIIRVELPSKLPPGQTMELKLEFSGRVPQVQREEASLLAHFLQEVNDAVSEERPVRDTRDIFFASEEAMLLGYFYPLLAVKPSQLTEQCLVAGAGSLVFSETADYEVRVTADDAMTVIASGIQTESKTTHTTGNQFPAQLRKTRVFKGENLRGFGLALAERVKSLEQQVGETRVVSYFREGDDHLGNRALNIAVRAIEAFSKSFGAYPYPIFQVIEMPLTAGTSDTELPCLVALAQAYYIDFDSPKAVRLPGVLREQADVIKTSFEFTLAHGVAHQWWGGIVGSDPERTPYLDEALSTYSAAYYHEVVYGKRLGEVVLEQHLQGTYQAYRMLGGVDLETDKPVRDFKNSLQFAAIVQAKGALMLAALRRELGDKKFFDALKSYYSAYRFRTVTPDQLRATFLNVVEDQRPVRAIFQRWLREKRGDEDIGTPDLTLLSPPVSKIRALGRVFVKIGKTAARPF